MKALKTFYALLCSFLLGGCTQAAFAVANAPLSFDEISRDSDIAYGSAPAHRLDIYTPPGIEQAKPPPVILFFHGGRWSDGDKNAYKFVGAKLAKMGYMAVLADFRKYPSVKFPVFVEDAAMALHWTHDHIAEYGGDPQRIILIGHSSGAHMAALLAADEHYLQALGETPALINAVVGLSGPYSFTPEAADLKDIFGPPSRYSAMMVDRFIDGHEPPMLLAWGAKDTVVERYNHGKLAAAIEEKGGRVEVKIYGDYSHTDTIKAFSWIGSDKGGLIDDIKRFIEAHP